MANAACAVEVSRVISQVTPSVCDLDICSVLKIPDSYALVDALFSSPEICTQLPMQPDLRPPIFIKIKVKGARTFGVPLTNRAWSVLLCCDSSAQGSVGLEHTLHQCFLRRVSCLLPKQAVTGVRWSAQRTSNELKACGRLCLPPQQSEAARIPSLQPPALLSLSLLSCGLD